MNATLLSVADLKVHFSVRAGGLLLPRTKSLKAVDGISFDLHKGETLGVVGESGCGKSTLARAIMMLIRPTAGTVMFIDDELTTLPDRRLRARRKDLQMIFQDPLASLDPRQSIGATIAEPLRILEPRLSRAERDAKVRRMLEAVGLPSSAFSLYPHEFSGGQCQRIGIARAMILGPKLVVCDEPVSALDVSIQAQIVNLLADLQDEFSLSMVFISHNLSIVRHISHRVMVMYLGRTMELGARDTLFEQPLHPYTQALLSAIPSPHVIAGVKRARIRLSAELPSPTDPPSGCVFHSRCPKTTSVCCSVVPQMVDFGDGHEVACHHPGPGPSGAHP